MHSNNVKVVMKSLQSILYFDICSLPIFLVILITVFVRRMTSGHSNRLFIGIIIISAFSAIMDVLMEIFSHAVPVEGVRMFAAQISTYLYFITRNGTIVGFFLFIFAITGTWYRIRSKRRKAIVLAPYAFLIALIITNPMTGAAFTITRDEGYQRGYAIFVIYAISALYATVGVIYLISCRKFLSTGKILPLIGMYMLSIAAAIVQFLFPELLVEMVTTSFALILLVLFVLRPEEVTDASVGSMSFAAYKNDLHRILLTKQKVQIAAICFTNASELRAYLGEERYLAYASYVISQLDSMFRKEHVYYGIYFEHPGTVYIIVDGTEYNFDEAQQRLTEELRRSAGKAANAGERIIPRACSIAVPEELNDFDEIIKFGREFHTYFATNRIFTAASEIISSRDYKVISNMDTILSRAIKQNSFSMFYQPIYSVGKKKFISAEALIRLNDEEYGFIPPGLFIPAAEKRGVILPIGDFVLEDVHRFISENELEGIEYIEINLSVAQCMQEELPEKFALLGDKYGVPPGRINLEITETTYENMGNVMEFNLDALSGMGYSFSLDDYGTGYSNMQRVSKLPLRIIKLDKTLIDDMSTDEGLSIVRNTVKMMRDIDKELVAEGVESQEDLRRLEAMGCDFIQGYYFSKPLPAEDFVKFIKERNKANA